jgi:cyclic pyranopterin phosphate synthase
VLSRFPEFRSLEQGDASQPVREFTGPGFRGTVGVISPVTKPFCNACNRIRVTADGKIRPCLGDNFEVDLNPAFSQDDSALVALAAGAIFRKPKGHRFKEGFISQRLMNRIGG